MLKRYLSLLGVLAVLIVLTACGQIAFAGDQESEADAGGSAELDTAGLIDVLKAAGASVEPEGQVNQDFFSVTGQTILLNGQSVQVFEYADAAQAEAEASEISEDGGSVGTSMIMWIDAPHFYRSGKLIVLYVGSDAGATAALEAALGAQIAGR